MLVVADSSPINVLIRIGCVGALEPLFGTVLMPPQVFAELTHPNTPEEVRRFMETLPSWMSVQTAISRERITAIDAGEEAAINLALDVDAAVLLIDDKDGRREAIGRQISVMGTLGILGLAADKGLLDLPIALDRLSKTDFRVEAWLIRDALNRDAARRRLQK